MSAALYLQRIGLDHAPRPGAQGLAALQYAHRCAIAFENLDIPLGRGIRIDSSSVFEKIVMRGRGGYCFEQNRLFADMLAQMVQPNRPLLARVLLGLEGEDTPPRTHVLLLANIDGQDWIADVGFGGADLPPLPLTDGASGNTPDGSHHRLRHIGCPSGEWLLERAGPSAATDGRARDDADWQAQYSFDLAHVEQADLDQANHWTATFPQSRFVLCPRLSIVLHGGFAAMAGTQLNLSDGSKVEKREIADIDEWRSVLADLFKLKLSAEEAGQLALF